MKLILRHDVQGVGRRGDVVEVADGYGRNFLLPRGLAMAAAGATAQAASMRRARDVKDSAARTAAQDIATRLVPTRITVTARAGAEGKLFGSITNVDIAEAVLTQAGIDLDRRTIHLDEPIRTVGEHTATAKLHAEVVFPISLDVVPA